MRHGIKHKSIAPTHIRYFRTHPLFNLVVKITFFMLHIGNGPGQGFFEQIILIFKFAQFETLSQ